MPPNNNHIGYTINVITLTYKVIITRTYLYFCVRLCVLNKNSLDCCAGFQFHLTFSLPVIFLN